MKHEVAIIFVCLWSASFHSGCATQPRRSPAEAAHSGVFGDKHSPNAVPASQAPSECVEVATDFIRYLFKEDTNIAENSAQQSKWLTAALRKELTEASRRCREEAARRPDDRIDMPSNSNFLLAWEAPSSYQLLGSRRYGNQAIVDVEYCWGQGTQYEGNRRTMSYVFVLENGSWRLDDVYCFREPFSQPTSLSQELRSMP